MLIITLVEVIININNVIPSAVFYEVISIDFYFYF